MIIQCDKCSTKFKLDEAKITGKGIRVRCTKCQNVFAVAPPAAAAAPVPAVDEGAASNVQEQGAGTNEKTGLGETAGNAGAGFDAGDAGFGGGEAGAGSGAGDAGFGGGDAGAGADDNSFAGFEAPPSSDNDLASQPPLSDQAFDFGTPPQGGFDAPEDGKSDAGGTDDWSIGGGESFDASGASHESNAGSEPEGESDAFGGGGFDAGGFDAGADAGGLDQGGESDAFGGDDTGAPPPHEEPFMQPPAAAAPVGNDWQIGKAEDEEAGDDKLKTGAEGGMADDNNNLPDDAAQADNRMPFEPPASKPNAEMSDKEFAAALSETTEEEHKAAVSGDKTAAKAVGASSNAKLIPIIVIVLIIIGAAVLFIGLRAGHEPVVAAPTVEIATVDGRYAETQNLGSIFVIEAKIKNVTAVPQLVKGVKGVLYDAKGGKLASAPGRIISSDDINNLTREDVAKVIKPSPGTIAPKGTLPIVVIFTTTPPGMSEFGVEIVP